MDFRAMGAGLEFMGGIGWAAAIFSAVHSSLWSARNFGDSPEKAQTCKSYSYVAAGFTLGTAGFASILAKSGWIFAGALVFTGLMVAGYRHSLTQANGSSGKGAELGY
jgi:hypothetical protein